MRSVKKYDNNTIMNNDIKYTKVIGSGSALPKCVVSNDDLVEKLAARGIKTSSEWIISRTGIYQRFLAEKNITTSQLAINAANLALYDAGIEASKIDLIIVATTTPDYIFPSTACLVQAGIGAKKDSIAFDIQAACSGFIYALTIADSFIRSNNIYNSLIIGTEIFSRILNWNDRNTCILFGDGSGAVVLTATYEPGIIATQLSSDGTQIKILYAANCISQGSIFGDSFLHMDGKSVFKKAVTVLEHSALLVCSKAGIKINQIDWLIPHQANIRILNLLAHRLGIPIEKVIITLDKHANTSAASIPMALDLARRDNRIKPGQLVLMQGVGGGFTWGSVLIRM